MTNWFTAHLMHHMLGRASQHRCPTRWKSDTLHRWLHDNLDSGALRGAQAQWDKITVPMYLGRQLDRHRRCICAAIPKPSCARPRSTRSCASTPAATCTRSTPRRGARDQLRFFDYWLKGIDNGVMDEPPVKLAIRKGDDVLEWRHENEWPLARTQWTKFYFDLSQRRRRAAADRHAGEGKSEAKRRRAPIAAFSLGTMGSTSAASSQVMGGGGIKPGMGVALETPPLRARHRGHRAARRARSGCRARARTWICS